MINKVKIFFSKITLPGVINIVLAIAGSVNLIAGTKYMVVGNGTLAGTGIGAGLILLLASTIDRFESLKGLGMEAKTRELRKTINDADAVVAKMKRLAEVTGATILRLAAENGRLGISTPAVEAYELSRSIKQTLEGVGTDVEVIRKALKPWAHYACFDVSYKIIQKYITELEKNDNPNHDFKSYISKIYDGISDWKLEECGKNLRNIFINVPVFVPSEIHEQLKVDVEKWAAEMDYLVENLDFRDSKEWLKFLKLE